MTPVLAFAIATVPDVAGIRTLYGFAADIADHDVAEFALQRQRARTGGDGLPHHLQRIVAVSCLLQQGDEITCRSSGAVGANEAALLQLLFDTVAQHSPCVTSWSGEAFAHPVLRYRALINGVPLPRHWQPDDAGCIGRRGLVPLPYAAVPLDEMARLCGLPAQPTQDSESTWRVYRAGRIDEIRARCDVEALTTSLLFLRSRLVHGALSTDEYRHAVERVRDWVGQQSEPHWRDFLAAWPLVTA
ncbi:3'-5' exonuclease [Pseudogulbenkiania sp. MAI-1]|uniref:3'-5' exonuclease n=1 Tax=Pseudogulbenkiania sp. MAI-1 TaxID=990370 RepID=UPI00045E7C2C|nr:3'-5' exonuclease [Pseudogulbenkiania sp. MAI-1]